MSLAFRSKVLSECGNNVISETQISKNFRAPIDARHCWVREKHFSQSDHRRDSCRARIGKKKGWTIFIILISVSATTIGPGSADYTRQVVFVNCATKVEGKGTIILVGLFGYWDKIAVSIYNHCVLCRQYKCTLKYKSKYKRLVYCWYTEIEV